MSIHRLSLLAVLILALLPHSVLGQGTRWIPPGSPAEDRLRIRQVMGQESTAGYLLRTASVLSVPPDPMEEPSGRGVGWRFELLPQEMHAVWNSDLPFSMNDGALWAGRGVNTLLRAGFRTT